MAGGTQTRQTESHVAWANEVFCSRFFDVDSGWHRPLAPHPAKGSRKPRGISAIIIRPWVQGQDKVKIREERRVTAGPRRQVMRSVSNFKSKFQFLLSKDSPFSHASSSTILNILFQTLLTLFTKYQINFTASNLEPMNEEKNVFIFSALLVCITSISGLHCSMIIYLYLFDWKSFQ